MQQENLNGTRNLTQQDIQTPSQFINEEIFETIVTTTQQSISPIHPNPTTPKPTTSILPQVTLQSTVKPSVAPKYSQMDYQTFRTMTKPPQKQRLFTRSNFAEHNYNYVNRSQTSKPPRTNPHNRSFSQRQNSQKQTSNFVNFNVNIRYPTDPSEFNRIKILNTHTKINKKHLNIHLHIHLYIELSFIRWWRFSWPKPATKTSKPKTPLLSREWTRYFWSIYTRTTYAST